MKFGPLLAFAAAVVAGCGGDHPQKARVVDAAPPPAPKVRAAPARPREVAVIRGWADTLRAGRVVAAARFFRLPAVVENGAGEIPLGSFADARAFNESLPCGAVLLDAKRVAGGYTLAVFRLTERPGPGQCGPGTGQRAATAFRFTQGRISEGRRGGVPGVEGPPPPPG